MAVLAYAGSRAPAQSLDDLNIQFHGYATQAFLYTNQNSWNTTDSAKGSFSWTEAVLNLSAQPEPKLRIGVQARFFVLGDLGNTITLDWAQADYKVNEHFGIRAGKVKTPAGLYNESQDIDPSQLWVLLPQSVYPIASRNTLLAHYGGVVYGSVPVGERFGKFEYRGFLGERIIGGEDGYFQPLRDEGITLPNGATGKAFGGTLRYLPPVRGLEIGASESSGCQAGEINDGPYSGTINIERCRQTFVFTKFERGKWLIAGEWSRLQALVDLQLGGLPEESLRVDEGPWYVMGSYKFTSKLTGGAYFSSLVNHDVAHTSPNYQEDWTAAARYDFSPFIYAKAEQHWINGTAVGFSSADNPNLQPTTWMSLVKLGVSF